MAAINFQCILALMKYKVSLAVTFTAIASYLLYKGSIDFHLVYMAIGVFVLAGGASGLNQYQEWKFDARMNRTRNRPIPSGKLSLLQALFVSFLLMIAGLAVLCLFTGLVGGILGLFNILWYNLFYTNLKKITAFAVVPGSFTGAIPALIGWTAAGGFIFDPRIMLLAFFLFIWQVPHFWLLLLKYGKEYEEAGFPSLNRSVRPENLMKISYCWIIATSIVSMMFLFFKIITSVPLYIGVLILNAWFVIIFTRFTFKDPSASNLREVHISLNAYMILFMLLLSFSQLTGG